MKPTQAPVRQPGPGELQPVFNLYNAGRLAEAANAALEAVGLDPALDPTNVEAQPSQAAGKRIDQNEWAMPTPKAVRELWFS